SHKSQRAALNRCFEGRAPANTLQCAAPEITPRKLRKTGPIVAITLKSFFRRIDTSWVGRLSPPALCRNRLGRGGPPRRGGRPHPLRPVGTRERKPQWRQHP